MSGYNFYIGGLGFNKMVNRGRIGYYRQYNTYSRQTAPFRKDQIDSSQTVGDQSLVGWWTRGQLSFHKGAGLTYYEVLDGNTILDRYQDSDAVNPWTPGEVSLGAANSVITGSSGAEDAVPMSYKYTPGVAAKVGNAVKFVSTSVGDTLASISSPSDPIRGIAGSGTATFCCFGSAIKASFQKTFTNYFPNPRFQAGGGTEMQPWGDVTSTTVRGGYLQFTSGATNGGGASAVISGLSSGITYRVVLEHQFAAHATTIRLDNGTTGTVIASGTSTDMRLVGNFTATATSHTIYVQAGTAATEYDIAQFSVTDDTISTDPNPVDDPTNWSWMGTPNDSFSTASTVVDTMSTLWTPPTGGTPDPYSWRGVWWAKGRLFVLDNYVNWYTLSTTGGTATTSDVFWSPTNMDTVGWSLTDAPNAVYVSKGTDIYIITLDSSGNVPTISTPTVAATMPLGEHIASVKYYLGYVIICTNRGVRVAEVQSDGSLVYGGLVISGDFSKVKRITGDKDIAYLAGEHEGDSTPAVFALNMTQMVDTLQPAYCRVFGIPDGYFLGVTVTSDEMLMAWDLGAIYRTSASSYATTGWLETGFHRLGTLDSKSFQYLRVKTEGAGSVVVDAVLPDGGVTNIGTITAGQTVDLSLATAIPGPQEYIGLKFTLNGDGTSTPKLLGYQIKALPTPKRQRLIQIPLQMYDSETNSQGRQMGTPKSAWTRLLALENYEDSNSVVTFTDKDTGETGTAFIESIELDSVAPSTARDPGNGFGGVVLVTLRKL